MIDIWTTTLLGFGIVFCLGVITGIKLRDWRWESVGEHAYMNRMESNGRLYLVKRIKK